MSQVPKMTTYEERERALDESEYHHSDEHREWLNEMRKTCPFWNISEETEEWLGNWLSDGAEITDLPQVVVQELKPYRLTGPTKLYRAEVTYRDVRELQAYTNCSSWSYSREMAKNFAEDRFHEDGSEVIIISTIALPKESLVDTTRLPTKFMNSFNKEELEVILLPGIYSLKL